MQLNYDGVQPRSLRGNLGDCTPLTNDLYRDGCSTPVPRDTTVSDNRRREWAQPNGSDKYHCSCVLLPKLLTRCDRVILLSQQIRIYTATVHN